MCVIVAKPAGTPIPSRDLLRQCFVRNPDGAGMMYPNASGTVSIMKGFSTFDTFDAALAELERQCDFTAIPLVMHFRIGTHGSKNDPRHTHPFPVCDSYERMEALYSEAPLAMAHNGIIRFGSIGNSRLDGPSDSMEFAKQVLLPLSRIEGWLDDVDVGNIVGGALTSSNKVVVMTGEGRMVWYGPRVDHVGCWWSNTSYEAYVPKPAIMVPSSVDYWKKASEAKQGELWGKWESPAEKVSNFILDFTAVAYDMQKMVELANKGMKGGYDEMAKMKLLFVKRPTKVTVKDKATKKPVTYDVFNPLDLYYTDDKGHQLYLLDFEEDVLYRLGEVIEINEKPSLHHVVGRKKDFRKSPAYAELYM